jgi:hypothetical protein
MKTTTTKAPSKRTPKPEPTPEKWCGCPVASAEQLSPNSHNGGRVIFCHQHQRLANTVTEGLE